MCQMCAIFSLNGGGVDLRLAKLGELLHYYNRYAKIVKLELSYCFLFFWLAS